MNTLHLKYAVEIERTGSISQAAANLYMGQPNLSKAMRELEASLGIVIFERSNKGVRPTVKGREFLAYAQKVLALVDEIEALCQLPEQPDSFRLSAPPSSYISYAFASFLQGLDKDRLKDVDFQENSSLRTIQNMREGLSQLGIIRYATGDSVYVERLLADNNLVSAGTVWTFTPLLIFSARHPLATRMMLSGSDLAPYTPIKTGDLVRDTHPLVDGELVTPEAIATSLNISEHHSQLHFLTASSAYLWSAPLPTAVLRDYNLVQRPCDSPTHRYTDRLIHGSGYRLSETDQLFLGELSRIRQEITAATSC